MSSGFTGERRACCRMKCTSAGEFELRLLGETSFQHIGARNSPSGWLSLSALVQKPVCCAPPSERQWQGPNTQNSRTYCG
jgi:hypothetical protein